MFEDILGTSKKKIIEKNFDVNICPYCGSSTVEEDSGVFASKNRYIQIMACQNCSRTWKICYDENLDIVDTEVPDECV